MNRQEGADGVMVTGEENGIGEQFTFRTGLFAFRSARMPLEKVMNRSFPLLSIMSKDGDFFFFFFFFAPHEVLN